MNHIDLFSGIGGFSLAASWVWGEDHNVVCFCEMDKFCKKVLNKHWPGVPIVEDVNDVKSILEIASSQRSGGKDRNAVHERRSTCESGGKSLQEDTEGRNGAAIPNDKPADIDGRTESPPDTGACSNVDLLTGGFPCQGFSVAGKQRGKEDHRYLWPQTLSVIKATRPRWCLLENVTGIIKLALDTVLADLEAEGYTCGVCVLPACAKNAPHRRDRVWIVGNTADLLMEAPRRGRDASKRVSGTPSEDDVADTEREGRIGRSGDGRANSNGVEKNQQTGDKPRGAVARCSEDTRGSTESRLGFQNNGVSRRMARHFPELWETDAWELGVPRVAVGVKDRVDRLKSLGNSIVPQVVYEIMMAIKESMRC